MEYFTLILLCTIITCSSPNQLKKTTQYISKNNITTSIIIENLKGDKRYIINKKQAATYFLPASTFKILNTLIALEYGAIKDEKKIIKWDGTKHQFSVWNKDQNIETAFPVSCVWFYQSLARKIGNKKYLNTFKKLKYGNIKTGPQVDTFWLNGDLRVTSHDQIKMLKMIYLQKYPFKKKNYGILKEIMIVEKTLNM